MATPMTLAKFNTLGPRDFENGAVMDEIAAALALAEDSIIACRAMVQWFDDEKENLSTFWDRANLCKYAEWSARKALGQSVGEFKGIPRLVIVPAYLDDAAPDSAD